MIQHGDALTASDRQRLLDAGQWMIRTSNGGVVHGFRWSDVGHWTVAPDWTDAPVCGGGLHGQSMDACGYAQPGSRFELCVWDVPAVVVDGNKRKVRAAAIVAVDREALDLWFALLPGGEWPGALDLGGYAHALPALTSIGGDAYLGGYAHALPALTSIGGDADLRGYAHADDLRRRGVIR